jgi:hypothetical protein
MIGGRLLALVLMVATAGLVVIGTSLPNQSAAAVTGVRLSMLGPSSSPQAAAQILAEQIARRDWDGAYSSLANKNEFTESEFVRDLTGSDGGLRNYAGLESFDLSPLHASSNEGLVRANLHWSTVVGAFQDVRDLRVIRTGDRWQVIWPIVKQPKVPPQVIPVNYLRWDVIYRGPGDDWGTQDVESPHVRIVAMHPIDRDGVVLLGELLNEDVVPAFVAVKATLLAKDGSTIATEDSFDKLSHVLLPKQVTPFRIDFRNVRLSQVDSVHIQPSASLIAASADPVVEIQDQRLNPLPDPSLSGRLVNQSGQAVNIAHVLGTFYDNRGQIVWVSDDYVDRALLPQIPTKFSISVPADLASRVVNYRVVTSTYSSAGFQ